MLTVVDIDWRSPDRAAALILEAWARHTVVHIRAAGLPEGEVRDFYDRVLHQVGTPRFLAEDVRTGDRHTQRTRELWMEVRYDPAFPDAYRHSPNAQPLHTDGSYIAENPNATLMCCVRNAEAGGETVFIAAERLLEALRAEAPDLLAELERHDLPHARSGDRRVKPVIRREAGELRLNWNYYCVADDVPAELQDLRARFFRFLDGSPAVRAALVPVKLRPGEAVVWKDERVLHGRNAFRATEASERFLWKCCVDVGVFESP